MASFEMTVKLSSEDRERMDKLIDRLLQVAEGLSTKKAEAEEPAPLKLWPEGLGSDEIQTRQKAEDKGPEPELFPIKKEEKKEETPKVTREEIQSKLIELVQAGKKAEAKDVIKSYAECASDVPEDKLGECMGRLAAL